MGVTDNIQKRNHFGLDIIQNLKINTKTSSKKFSSLVKRNHFLKSESISDHDFDFFLENKHKFENNYKIIQKNIKKLSSNYKKIDAKTKKKIIDKKLNLP